MNAKELMTQAVRGIDKDERLESVLDLMRKGRMSKLIVTEKGACVGVITDGDVADEIGAMKNRGVATSHLHASSAMRRKFATIPPDAPLKRILELLIEDDAGILPVIHDRICVGVITASDLLPHVKSTKPVQDFMTTHLQVVAPGDRVVHARRVMVDNHIERLPVLDGGKLVGIVGEMDIALGLARFKDTVADNHQAAAIQRFLVEDVMETALVTTTPEVTAADAARLMKDRDVGSLPVLRAGRLVGIITRSDLLRLVVPTGK